MTSCSSSSSPFASPSSANSAQMFGGFRPRRSPGNGNNNGGRSSLSHLLQRLPAMQGGAPPNQRRKTAVEILDEALGVSMAPTTAGNNSSSSVTGLRSSSSSATTESSVGSAGSTRLQ